MLLLLLLLLLLAEVAFGCRLGDCRWKRHFGEDFLNAKVKVVLLVVIRTGF